MSDHARPRPCSHPLTGQHRLQSLHVGGKYHPFEHQAGCELGGGDPSHFYYPELVNRLTASQSRYEVKYLYYSACSLVERRRRPKTGEGRNQWTRWTRWKHRGSNCGSRLTFYLVHGQSVIIQHNQKRVRYSHKRKLKGALVNFLDMFCCKARAGVDDCASAH